MRLVLDTNIVVSGLIWGGNPKDLLALAVHSQVALFTSEPLLAELADVLARPKIARLLARGGTSPSQLLQPLAVGAEIVRLGAIERVVSSDPDDDVVIATALAAQADVIATGDRDLIRLHPYREIRILNAADALQYVKTVLRAL